jgi:hypothetical protein
MVPPASLVDLRTMCNPTRSHGDHSKDQNALVPAPSPDERTARGANCHCAREIDPMIGARKR